MYSLLLAIIYLAFVGLGLPDSLLGSAWPIMHAELGVSLSYAGILSMIVSGGTIVSSLLSDTVTRKFGTKYVTLFSTCLSALAIFGFSVASEFWMLCLLAIPYGLAAGSIDAALNNYVALHYSSKHMNWLHSFWGLGTIISPYIMSAALTFSSWEWGYRTVSFIQIGISAILLVSLALWRVNKDKEDTALDNRDEPIGILGAVKLRGVPYLLVGFFCYCAAEATALLWSGTYFSQVSALNEKTAAALASMLCIGITLGRFVSGFVANKVSDIGMIRIGTGISFIGILLIALTPLSTFLAIFGFVLLGLGFAPVYPSLIHYTPHSFGEKNSQSIIGLEMASAYIGSTLMPPVFGLFAEKISMKLLPFFMLVFVILMIIMIEKLHLEVQKSKGVK